MDTNNSNNFIDNNTLSNQIDSIQTKNTRIQQTNTTSSPSSLLMKEESKEFSSSTSSTIITEEKSQQQEQMEQVEQQQLGGELSVNNNTNTTTSTTTSSPLKLFLSKLFSKRRKSTVDNVGTTIISNGANNNSPNNNSPNNKSKNQAFKNLLTPHSDSSSSLNNPNNNISNITSHSTNNIINSSTSGRKSKRLSATFFKRRHTTQLSQSPITSSTREIENFREEAIKRQIQQCNHDEVLFNSSIQPPNTTTSPSSSVTTINSAISISLTPNVNTTIGNTPHPNRTKRSSSSKSIPDNADTFFDENSAFDMDDLMWITMEPTTTRTSFRPKTVSSNSLISVTSNNGNSSTGRRDSAAHSSVNDEEIVDDLEVIIPSITIDDGSIMRTLSPTTSSTNNNNNSSHIIQPPSVPRHVNSWDLDDDIEAHNSFSFSPGSMNASNIINL